VAYNGGLHIIINSMDNTVGSLTQIQRSIIIGSLLGDGYLRIVPGRSNALLEINHSYSQKEYVDWKFKMLESLCRSAPKMRKGNGNRVAYRFSTRQSRELTAMYKIFYKNRTKQVPFDITLDPIMLAVWFMDDGSMCRESDVYLNTQQFSNDDQIRCKNMLERIGIECAINKDKTYSRLRFKKSSLLRLRNLIIPHIIPSMSYKLSYSPVET